MQWKNPFAGQKNSNSRGSNNLNSFFFRPTSIARTNSLTYVVEKKPNRNLISEKFNVRIWKQKKGDHYLHFTLRFRVSIRTCCTMYIGTAASTQVEQECKKLIWRFDRRHQRNIYLILYRQISVTRHRVSCMSVWNESVASVIKPSSRTWCIITARSLYGAPRDYVSSSSRYYY